MLMLWHIEVASLTSVQDADLQQELMAAQDIATTLLQRTDEMPGGEGSLFLNWKA